MKQEDQKKRASAVQVIGPINHNFLFCPSWRLAMPTHGLGASVPDPRTTLQQTMAM
jgi:hypothetical protein